MVFKKGNVQVIKKQLEGQTELTEEVKLTNEEKVIAEKDDILTKIKNIDTVWDYFKIFDIPINSTTLNIMYTHFGLTDTKKYGIQGCGPGMNDLFNLLRNTSYKEVLQLFNK